jgi:hypothetical protein
MEDLYNNKLKITLTNINNIFKKTIKKLQNGGYFETVKKAIEKTDIKFPKEKTKQLLTKITNLDTIIDKIISLLGKDFNYDNIEAFNKYVSTINKSPAPSNYTLRNHWNAHFFDLPAEQKDAEDNIVANITIIGDNLKNKLSPIIIHPDEIEKMISDINKLFVITDFKISNHLPNSVLVLHSSLTEQLGSVLFISTHITNCFETLDFNHSITFGQTGNLNLHIQKYNEALPQTKEIKDIVGGNPLSQDDANEIKTTIHKIMSYYDKLHSQKEYITNKQKNIEQLNLAFFRLKHYIFFNIYMLNMSGIGNKKIYKFVNEEIIKYNYDQLTLFLSNLTSSNETYYYYHYYILVKLRNFFEFLIQNIFNIPDHKNKHIEISKCTGIILENFILFNYFKHYLDTIYNEYKPIIIEDLEVKKDFKLIEILPDSKILIAKPTVGNWNCPVCQTTHKNTVFQCSKCSYKICQECNVGNFGKVNQCEINVLKNLLALNNIPEKYRSIKLQHQITKYPYDTLFAIFTQNGYTITSDKTFSNLSLVLLNENRTNHWTCAKFAGNWMYYDNNGSSKIGGQQQFKEFLKDKEKTHERYICKKTQP